MADWFEGKFPTRNVFRGDQTRQRVPNPDGSYSTERSITVTDERINEGKPTNIPSMYGGKQVDQETAIEIIMKNGGVDPETGRELPAFDTVEAAVEAAKARSDSLPAMEPWFQATEGGVNSGPTRQDTKMADIEFGMQLWPYLNWVGKLGFDAERTHVFSYDEMLDRKNRGADFEPGMGLYTDTPFAKGSPDAEAYRELMDDASIGRSVLDVEDKVFIRDDNTSFPDTYGHEYMHRGLDVMARILKSMDPSDRPKVPFRDKEISPLSKYGWMTDIFGKERSYDPTGAEAHKDFIYPEHIRIIEETLSNLDDEAKREFSRANAKRHLQSAVDVLGTNQMYDFDIEHIDAMNALAKELFEEYNKREPEEQQNFLDRLKEALFGGSEKSE